MKIITEDNVKIKQEVLKLPYFGEAVLTDTTRTDHFIKDSNGYPTRPTKWGLYWKDPRFQHMNFMIEENGDLSIRAYFHSLIYTDHWNKNLMAKFKDKYLFTRYHFVKVGEYWTPFLTLRGHYSEIQYACDIFQLIRERQMGAGNYVLEKNGDVVVHLPKWVTRVADDGSFLPQQLIRKKLEAFSLNRGDNESLEYHRPGTII